MKVKATIGVFGGIINKEGKLLLRKRTETSSIIPGKSFEGNWELPGGGVDVKDNMSYSHLVESLKREIYEELGIELSIDLMPAMYPVFYGKLQDLAMVVLITNMPSEPKKGNWQFVSLEELNTLAKEFKPANKETGEDGQGLVSGYGKRMHCMALKTLALKSQRDDREVIKTLSEIQKGW